MARSSRPGEVLWSRREVLASAGVAAVGLALPFGARAEDAEVGALPAVTRQALETSPYVYISPLRSSGEESRCHGEVWFFSDGGDPVIATGKDAWKARALARGLDRARVWVGDFGRVRFGNERFRTGPSFDARVTRDEDPAVFERLLASFGKKYPDEWGKWEPRFRKGYKDGSRVVLRYSASS